MNFPSVAPGRRSYVRQQAIDRHQMTVHNSEVLKVATWNVRPLHQERKLSNMKREMARIGIDLLGMSEVSWSRVGRIDSEETAMVYFGGETAETEVKCLWQKNYPVH